MDHCLLGSTGIRISRLGLGTMAFGDTADEETSRALYRRAREAGVNVFDCANVYSAGRAEEFLGRLIAPERNQVILTTKVGFPMGTGSNDQGLSRRHILSSVEDSLRRLRTDRVEFLFVHTLDPATQIEVTLRALDDLVRQGKVLHVGVSNWAAWQIATALAVARQHDWTPFACVQPMYNLVKRQAEVEILPLCQAERLGVLTYSPLGGGLLSGAYGRGRAPEEGRLVRNRMYQARYGDEAYFETADRFVTLAQELGVHPATLAVAWVAAHPAVTAPILGARNVEQLEPSLAAAEWTMSAEVYARVAALSPTPPPATDRTEEARGVAYAGSTETYH